MASRDAAHDPAAEDPPRKKMTVAEWLAMPIEKRPYPTAAELEDFEDAVVDLCSRLIDQYESECPPVYIRAGRRYNGELG